MRPGYAERPGPQRDRHPTPGEVTRLIELEEARQARANRRVTEAQATLIEAEAERLQAETEDLALSTFHRSAFFVVALGMALIVLVQLVLDPGLLSALGGAGFVALLGWLGQSLNSR